MVEKGLSHSGRLFKVAEVDLLLSLAQLDQLARRGHQLPCPCSPEGKIIIAAFVDSYNQLVKAVRNYKAQTVKGGLGTGGTLGVQGGSTSVSQALTPSTSAAPAAGGTATKSAAPVKSTAPAEPTRKPAEPAKQ